ncbi:MAG: ribosome maturation factor RimM, partial [Acholeplasmataceae bacterium]
EVKIYNLSDFNRFFVDKTVIVRLNNQDHILKIKAVRQQKNLLIVKFEGYDDINNILPFKGCDLYSNDDPRDELLEDEFHYHDLVDKDVFGDKGELIGTVIRVLEVPQGHMIEVRQSSGKKTLIPFSEHFIAEINEDRIVIKMIEGLL